jgi:hypothetical protein
VQWISEQLENGALAFRVGRRGEELVAEFAGIGTLFASKHGEASRFEPLAGAPPVLVEKVKGSLVPALLRHASSRLTLHGSAIAKGGGAVACIGLSGTGKSTLAASLCARHGTALVADDTAAIDLDDAGAKILPTERVSWLVNGSDTPARGEEKWAVPPRAVASSPMTLRAVCTLVFDETAPAATLRQLRGHEALAALVPAVVRLVVDVPAVHEWELEELGRLVAGVPIHELRRPPGPEGAAVSARRIAALLGGTEGDEALP